MLSIPVGAAAHAAVGQIVDDDVSGHVVQSIGRRYVACWSADDHAQLGFPEHTTVRPWKAQLRARTEHRVRSRLLEEEGPGFALCWQLHLGPLIDVVGIVRGSA